MRVVPAGFTWAWVAVLLAAALLVAVELARVTSGPAVTPPAPRVSASPPVAEGELLGMPETEAIDPSAAPILTR